MEEHDQTVVSEVKIEIDVAEELNPWLSQEHLKGECLVVKFRKQESGVRSCLTSGKYLLSLFTYYTVYLAPNTQQVQVSVFTLC